MKIALWTASAAVGLTLAACGQDNNTVNVTPSPPPTSSAPSGAQAPTDFGAFVGQEIGTQPSFGSAPVATTSLTTNTALGVASTFAATPFGTGDTLPTGTFAAATACTAAGKTACNPTTSADLNSTLN